MPPGKPQFHKFLGQQRATIRPYWPKSIYIWRWSGYISMPHFRPFLPWVLLRMPRKSYFTIFFGHQKAEIGPVVAKNRFISAGGQDTSACRISSHLFLPSVLLGIPGNVNLTIFGDHAEGRNWASSGQNRFISGVGQDTWTWHISGHSSSSAGTIIASNSDTYWHVAPLKFGNG